MKKRIHPIPQEIKDDVKSYIEATDPDTRRFCPTCNNECVEGQAMWNGWFIREPLYHYECVPEHLREKWLK